MPCDNPRHDDLHVWPSTGHLFICRCETRCGYCSFDELSEAAFENPSYVSLRQRVKASHMKSFLYAGVRLEPGHRGRVAENMCPCEAKALAKGKWAREEEYEESDEELPPPPSALIKSENTSAEGLTRKRNREDVISMVERWSSDVIEPHANRSAKKRRIHAEIDAKKSEQVRVGVITNSGKTHRIRRGHSKWSSDKMQDDAQDATEQQEARLATTHEQNKAVRRTTNCGKGGDTSIEDIYASAHTPDRYEESKSAKLSTCKDEQINASAELRSPSPEAWDASSVPHRARSCAGQSIADARDTEEPASLALLQGQLDVIVRWANSYEEQIVVAKLLSDAAKHLRGQPSRRG